MLYEGLNQKRGELFKKTYSDINEYIEKAEKVHKQAQEFIESLNNQDLEKVKVFICK